ncbi:hypothetical protein [uncultured Mycobacterium sp.]|uniref:hypothetical protein n=1 Tax=uncultured Mycobacterium sp. TaxID=171292 RepID=UPI0035CC8821
MGTGEAADRFDELRRAWIAEHQGWSTIQRRRAEQLGRRVRARQRRRASAVPDPHDDTVLPPLWLRPPRSPASQLETVFVLSLAMVNPLGWLGGWILKHVVTRLIPGALRSYPIASLWWSGAGMGLLITLAYELVLDRASSFSQIAVLPWVCVQLAAVPVVAGMYGIAEGWLAVPGSTQWWPLTPPNQPLSPQDAASILGGYDLTGPALVDARRLDEPGERTRP